jgi:mRNA-degrading endonuclease RelE of RelBE toxin-antitoxin system
MVFEPLAEHPQSRGTDIDVHQLWGYQNVWTLRIPPWRCIYAIDGNEVVIIVFGHRDDVYARLHGLLPLQKQFVTRSAVGR